MEGCVFPRTAVIATGSRAAAEMLIEFLKDNGYQWDTHDSLSSGLESRWSDYRESTCFDIESTNKVVCHCSRTYYEEEFEDDYPELMPDDDKWFLCSVDEFIAMCNGVVSAPDFETADEAELSSFLFS